MIARTSILMMGAGLALCLAASPLAITLEGAGPAKNTALAVGAGGGGAGAGGGGAGAAGGAAGAAGTAGGDAAGTAGASGAATAAAATSSETQGLDKATSVVGTTPAHDDAEAGLTTAQDSTSEAGDSDGEGTSEGMSLGQALGNMATEAKEAVAALFGGDAE